MIGAQDGSCRLRASVEQGAGPQVAAERAGTRRKSEVAPLLAVLLDVNKQVAWLDSRFEHLAKSDVGFGERLLLLIADIASPFRSGAPGREPPWRNSGSPQLLVRHETRRFRGFV